MKPVSMSVFALIVLSMAAHAAETWTPDNGNGTFTNPLFYEEFSDPDLIRVGEDYYLTGTTMHSMPGLPVTARTSTGKASGRRPSDITTARSTSSAM
ncbi:MAG: glycoside hydrolase [Geminicoccaceae bacterium]|nr:glycoside hydrolase [Geminicoccaceae bacterium]